MLGYPPPQWMCTFFKPSCFIFISSIEHPAPYLSSWLLHIFLRWISMYRNQPARLSLLESHLVLLDSKESRYPSDSYPPWHLQQCNSGLLPHLESSSQSMLVDGRLSWGAEKSDWPEQLRVYICTELFRQEKLNTVTRLKFIWIKFWVAVSIEHLVEASVE